MKVLTPTIEEFLNWLRNDWDTLDEVTTSVCKDADASLDFDNFDDTYADLMDAVKSLEEARDAVASAIEDIERIKEAENNG